MFRAAPIVLQASPFANIVEAQAEHLALIARVSALTQRFGNTLPTDDHAAAVEIARTRRLVRSFEWRMAATGAALPDPAQRGFAQSLLDFWTARQADLRALGAKFRPTRSRGLTVSPGACLGRLLVDYDAATGHRAAEEAEAAYTALPTETDQHAAQTMLVAIAQQRSLPSESEHALAAFLAAGTVVRSADSPAGFVLGHASLPTDWTRLSEWLTLAAKEQAERERIRSAAEAWKESGKSSELPRGEGVDRVIRYSRDDDTLTEYAVAARNQKRREIAFAVIRTIVVVALAFLGLRWCADKPPASQTPAPSPIVSSAPSPADTSAADNADIVTEEVAADQDYPDAPIPAVAADTPKAIGATGWIWIGSEADPQISVDEARRVRPAQITPGMRLHTTANRKLRREPPQDDSLNKAGERTAGLPAGAPAIALGTSRPVTVKGTVQYWLEVRLVPVVYVQLDDNSTVPTGRLREALAARGFSVQREQRLPNVGRNDPQPRFDVRFYYPQDAAAAAEVARIAATTLPAGRGTATVAPRSLADTPLARRVTAGTIELWLFQK